MGQDEPGCVAVSVPVLEPFGVSYATYNNKTVKDFSFTTKSLVWVLKKMEFSEIHCLSHGLIVWKQSNSENSSIF